MGEEKLERMTERMCECQKETGTRREAERKGNECVREKELERERERVRTREKEHAQDSRIWDGFG